MMGCHSFTLTDIKEIYKSIYRLQRRRLKPSPEKNPFCFLCQYVTLDKPVFRRPGNLKNCTAWRPPDGGINIELCENSGGTLFSPAPPYLKRYPFPGLPYAILHASLYHARCALYAGREHSRGAHLLPPNPPAPAAQPFVIFARYCSSFRKEPQFAVFAIQ